MRGIIQNAPFGVFLAMVGVPLAMAAVAVIAGFSARRTASVVKSTKAVPIGMAENGYRQFEGRVEAVGGETVVAPLTGSPCVWYSASVDEWKRTSTTATKKSEWVTVRSVESSAPLVVRDATGACVVRLFGADITPTDKSRWTGATLEPADRNPPRVGPSESTDGFVQVSGGPNSRYRYTEKRIYAGDPLMVVGLFDNHRFDQARDLDDLPPDPSIAPGWTPDTDDEDDLQATATPQAAGGAVMGANGRMARDAWDAADIERHDTLTRLAESVTKAEIQQGGRGQPLIIAATSAATHVAMNEMGAQAAFTIALLPLGIAALVVLARFG